MAVLSSTLSPPLATDGGAHYLPLAADGGSRYLPPAGMDGGLHFLLDEDGRLHVLPYGAYGAYQASGGAHLTPVVAPRPLAFAAPPASSVSPSREAASEANSFWIAIVGVIGDLKSHGLCPGLEFPPAELPEAKVGKIFERVVAAFLGEVLPQKYRPMPPVLGDGRHVDLLRLYLAVGKRGGSRDIWSWSFVAEDIGLDLAAGTAVKMVYEKYLGVLEQRIQNKVVKEGVKSNAISTTPQIGLKKDKFLSPVKERRTPHHKMCENIRHGDVGLAHLKRKRESLVGMLNWVRSVAKNPCDLSMMRFMPSLSEALKGRVHDDADYFSLAVLMRQTIFLENVRNLGPDGSPVLTWQKEKASCSQTVQSPTKQPGSIRSTGALPCYATAGNITLTASSDEKMLAEREHLGLAEVPEWSGSHSVSADVPDMLRWLGTSIWPPKKDKTTALFSLADQTVGKGRLDNCGCQYPGYIDCIRLHVAENRNKIIREMGSAFFEMAFDRMGEEVALLWTKDEEKKFNSIIYKNLPSYEYNFWNDLYPNFRYKGSQNLVSYYYNVFLLRRRAHQNHLTPNSIDSDDDSIEASYLCNPLGHVAGESSSKSNGFTRNIRVKN